MAESIAVGSVGLMSYARSHTYIGLQSSTLPSLLSVEVATEHDDAQAFELAYPCGSCTDSGLRPEFQLHRWVDTHIRLLQSQNVKLLRRRGSHCFTLQIMTVRLAAIILGANIGNT